MNRTIKFRGQILNSVKDDKGNVVTEWKSWIYGDLLHRSNGVLHILTLNEKKACYENNTIDPETLGQFTGLLDKDGKEIYEGDIISVNGKYPKLVKYIDDYACFCLANIEDLDEKMDTGYWHQVSPGWWNSSKREIRVIGNIYDHPDLIKEEDK
ncbi:YopX family protein [Bacteroides sp. D2]|jgi:uncharacterized phage protein (TIGR01671 family)|uniref:YopX family protein n=1 Tax=Bacteroides sp. D2 TaxID=556259 RepID=UPI0001BC82DB|nr:YopX family protein [Bacteroides sp. D2]EFS33760.1 hypothetical protein BSGG_4460 [Bacteroides sp. D2]UWN98579.1 YopX family protein [Bacteroides sp. D2]